MNDDDVIAKLREKLRELCRTREYIDEQLVNTNLALNSLARGVANEKDRQEILQEIAAARFRPGLTERISRTLRAMPYTDLSASDVRVWLEREGVDLSGYSQPLATISVTLARMARSGRVNASREGRRVTYRWNGD